MPATAVMERRFEVSDVSGQKVVTVSHVPADATVSEIVEEVLAKMRLPRNDAEGRLFTYHMRLDREGRHLLGAERVADSLQTGDRVVLQPNVDAGSTPCAAEPAS
jgi:hypothetical protein